MATPSSPFSFLDDLFNRIGERLQPPAWAVHEIQQYAYAEPVRSVDQALPDRANPQQSGALAKQTGLTPGAITGLVDRLEHADVVDAARHDQAKVP